jgi:hypothetical protein
VYSRGGRAAQEGSEWLEKGDEGALDLSVSLALPSVVDNIRQNRPRRRGLSPVPRGRYPPNGLIGT